MSEPGSVSGHCQAQYELIKSSRQVLFDYCRKVYPKDLVNENNSFGRGGSMRNLLVHIANVYESWIGREALKKDIAFTSYTSANTIEEIVLLFGTVDTFMDEFLDRMNAGKPDTITYTLNDTPQQVSALTLFTHVITHEFHHKGQILSLSRHLGYTPVDTDIIR